MIWQSCYVAAMDLAVTPPEVFRHSEMYLMLYSFSFLFSPNFFGPILKWQVSECLVYWDIFILLGNCSLEFSQTLHQKSFLLRISTVNVTKSVVSCRFGHIYWRNPKWKTSFFVQWNFFVIQWKTVRVKVRSSHSKMLFKIGALKNVAIFTGKHLCWILFFNKFAGHSFSNTSGGCFLKMKKT